MTKPHAAFAVMLVLAGEGLRSAMAAPPTVIPSPGYDARLQEQRKAMSAWSRAAQPLVPSTRKATHHRSRRKN